MLVFICSDILGGGLVNRTLNDDGGRTRIKSGNVSKYLLSNKYYLIVKVQHNKLLKEKVFSYFQNFNKDYIQH